MTAPSVQIKQSVYITGHCSNGNHEGTKNLSEKGTLFPACAGEYYFSIIKPITCTCWCHEMFQMARDAKRAALVDTYTGSDIPLQSPSVDLATTSAPTDTVSVVAPYVPDDEFWRKVLDHQDITLHVYRFVSWHVFGIKGDKSLTDRTINGRRPRGSLDINVEAICRLSLEGKIPQELTPQTVAMLIDPIDAPSAGAIHAVFSRWLNAGYITMQKKPVMMTGFTDKVGKAGITGAKQISAREREARAKGFFL